MTAAVSGSSIRRREAASGCYGKTEKEVDRRNLVKDYEFRKNTYLLLPPEDVESIKVESSEVMNVEKFVDGGSIDPLYYDMGYFLGPAETRAGTSTRSCAKPSAGRARVALSRLVIGERERVIALRPRGDGLAQHTLHEQRDLDVVGGLFDAPSKVDEEMVAGNPAGRPADRSLRLRGH